MVYTPVIIFELFYNIKHKPLFTNLTIFAQFSIQKKTIK